MDVDPPVNTEPVADAAPVVDAPPTADSPTATTAAAAADKPTEETPPRRESRRLRERERSAAPVLVALPTHPRTDRESSPSQADAASRRPGGGSAPPLHFSTKHYPASAHGDGARRAGHTHFPRLPPDHAPGPLPDGASASFSYRGPPQPPVPGAAPPVPPPPGGTPLVLDRGDRPSQSTAPEFEYAGGPSQQAVLANMLSQRIDQVDQLRTQLAHAEARIASLSARSNPSAALAQAEARAEAAEARLAAIKDGWRGVENYLDMLSRREAEARTAFVRTLGTGEIGVPPSVPVFGAGPTSPYASVRPPVPPNVPSRTGPTFPALPPAPVVGGPSVIWRHESGLTRRRPGPNDPDESEPPHKRQRAERRRDRDREREREVRKEKARFSDSPSPPPTQKEDTDLSPPIAALNASDDKDADADGDADEEVDQIVDDVEMAGPNGSNATATRPRRSSDTAAAPPTSVRAGSASAKSEGAVKDLKKDVKAPKDAKTNGTNGTAVHDENLDAEGSPETDTDELSVDEELLKLTDKSRRPVREYDGYERHSGQYEEYASRGPPRDEYPRDDYPREYARGPNGPGPNGDPRYHHPGWYNGAAYYDGEQYRDPHRPYAPPVPRGDFSQRNGSGASASAPWYAHLKQGSNVATNTQGQRTCRQCGLAGRYKDGKCVEKWGPGPEGPGTVCDRCRKKMKRVERRGTADASMLAAGLAPLPLHQHSFHSQSQSQSQPTQPQSQSQLSQTQLGTQYSPQRWNGNGRYENGAGRYDEGAAGPRGEKRYDLLPSHYGPSAGNGTEAGADEETRRKSGGKRKEREPSAEPAGPKERGAAVTAEA